MVCRRYSRRVCLLFSFLFLVGVWPNLASANVSEDDVKLVLLYKITRFIDWPESGGSENPVFRLCLAGEDTFAAAQARLGNRRIQSRDIHFSLIDGAGEILSCDAVYIADSARERVSELLERTADRPILTVSDAPGFVEQGGMVGLSIRNNRVGMHINVAAYQRAGLAISSQLLELATLVESEGHTKP